jgi:hypothetical protein
MAEAMVPNGGSSFFFFFFFCIAAFSYFCSPSSLFLLLFLMMAQGSSRGGNKVGGSAPFSFLLLPSFSFLPSHFLSFSFSVLFPFVSFLLFS